MSSHNGAEKVALMNGEDFEEELDVKSGRHGGDEQRHYMTSFWKQNKGFIGLHICLIALYSTIFWSLSVGYWKTHQASSSSLVYSPAHEAVRFRKQSFDAELVIESDYIGDPTPATDHAWHVLLGNMNIAVPASDLQKINTKSIQVPGEPGMYIAGLSVYHELHCLKRLRQHTWIDVYFPNQTAEDARLQRLHTDHCIDVLRQAILCRADVSLFTLQWSENSTAPRADFSHEHQCVDWEALDAWAGERAVPEEKMKHLEHPTHGPAFPNGHGSRLGASEDKSPTIFDHDH
ncbi:hypothetical protein N0V90_005856 [Kalmusia sp. IMI 367209]|nr:hypothetical protein N0V90_005856 [Kalmusia sp. IMI 367209]